MSRSAVTLLVWVITVVIIAIVWVPLSWRTSGSNVALDFDVIRLLVLAMITIAAFLLYRRFQRR